MCSEIDLFVADVGETRSSLSENFESPADPQPFLLLQGLLNVTLDAVFSDSAV